jgi:hypothetical protein
MRRITISLYMVSFLLVSFSASQQSKFVQTQPSCSREEAMQADRATDSLRNWNSVYRFYKRFSRCDDGGIAEGVSDKVAKLLANRWDLFNDFVRLASNDQGFQDFVIRHLDETIDWGRDAPKIHESARLHCPSNSTRLCKLLIKQTTPQG